VEPREFGFLLILKPKRMTMKIKTAQLLAAAMLMTLTAAGCTTIKETASDFKKSVVSIFWGADENLTAEELAINGMDEFDKGNYHKSIEHFQRLKDIYPFSKYAILAELKLGDAHYQLMQYEDALFAYEEFEKLHPRNEAVPYVIYQIGRCHFDRISTPDRDQTAARKALETFSRLQKQYPNDPYSRSAAEHMVACYKSLSGHEFIVGEFYFKSKHFKAALARFRTVVSDYPDVGYHQPALNLIAACERRLSEETARTKEGPDAPATQDPLLILPENG
jgi:outer membrane protein assembly factor BamD